MAHRRITRSHPDLVAGRVVGAALLSWMAWIHLHLWKDGYRHLHVIGGLFLLNFVVGVLLALALLAVPERRLLLAAGAGAVMAGGALVALAVSINIGLFAFKDSLNAPFAPTAIGVEAAAVVVLAATALRSVARPEGRPSPTDGYGRPGRGGHRAGPA